MRDANNTFDGSRLTLLYFGGLRSGFDVSDNGHTLASVVLHFESCSVNVELVSCRDGGSSAD